MPHNEIKFEAEIFKNECFNTYEEQKDKLKNYLDETCDKILRKLDTEINNNIVKTLNGKDLYDYSDVEAVTDEKEFIFLIRNSQNPNIPIKEIKPFVNGEKVIINHQSYKQISNTGFGQQLQYDGSLKITNYGRAVKYVEKKFYCYHDISMDFTTVYDNDFWIPTDYITIIKHLISYDHAKLIPCDSFVYLLELMKRILYNRQFTPLYVNDIIKENDELKSKYEDYENKMTKFYKDKEHFETNEKPYLDLVNSVNEINKFREELETERQKLKLVAMKLELDRKKLDNDLEKIHNLNVSEILK